MKCIKCGKQAVCSGFCRNHFVDYVERKVRRTIRKFGLLRQKQKIGVAVSGGKDSTTLLYLLNKFGYSPIGITVDASIGEYTYENLKNLKSVCGKYKIPLEILSFREEFGFSLPDIQKRLKSKGIEYANCMVCGILKRYLVNRKAKELGLDVVATGHNLDDEAAAFMMNVFRNDQKLVVRQGPVSGAKSHKKFVKRVKPLYLCLEKEIETYSRLMKFPVNYERCPHSSGSFRRDFKNMMDDFEKRYPSTKYNAINFFLDMILPQKSKVKGSVGSCELCGEPSSGDICKKCQIIVSLKN